MASPRYVARTMLSGLMKLGISAANFERALRLPQGTTRRWEAGEAFAEDIALLRCVRLFPGLLDVSDRNFDALSAGRP